MEANLSKFKCTQILNTNQTEKILYLLGTIEGQDGQAIAIFTPKLLDFNKLQFTNVVTAFLNDIYSRFTADLSSTFDIQLIYPVTEKHKNKYKKRDTIIHRESAEEYRIKQEELLKKELKHIQWVTNILEGKSEAERVLYKCEDFVVLPDFKCVDLKDINNLHLMTIFNAKNLQSLRDLKQEHLPLLQRTVECIEKVLVELGVNSNQCRMYFHYPPTFYQLHIHIMHLNLESLSCRVERCHELFTVIENLKIKGTYYQEVALNTFQEK